MSTVSNLYNHHLLPSDIQIEQAPSAAIVESGDNSSAFISNLPSPMSLFAQKQSAVSSDINRVYVGELHELWQFPSDHLPIGVKANEFQIVTWNVLNNAFMNWVTEKDSQGLNGSLISELDSQKINGSGLTKRDQLVIEMIVSMAQSNTNLINLQECGTPFLNELETQLPSNWKILKCADEQAKDQTVILYNSDLFRYLPSQSEVAHEGYLSSPGRPILNAAFEAVESNQIVRVINAHIPGDPNLPGTDEYAAYVKKFCNTDDITIALGDYNFERQQAYQSFVKAGFKSSDFSLISPWQTNIDPYTKESKAIDHVFIHGTKAQALKAEQIASGYNLEESIELLQNPR